MEKRNSASRGRQQRRVALTDRYADQGIPVNPLTSWHTRGFPVRLSTYTHSSRATRDPTGAPPRRLLTFSRHEGVPHP